MNGRMYDANLGRFLSPDNYIQDPFNTQSFNRYGYVLNNPLSNVDPSGESFWKALASIVVSIAITVVGIAVGVITGSAFYFGAVVDFNTGDWQVAAGSFGATAVFGEKNGEFAFYGNYKGPLDKDKDVRGSAIDIGDDPPDDLGGGEQEEVRRNIGGSDPWPIAFSITGTLIADDVTGVGAFDDFAIPVILAGAATYDLTKRVFITYTLESPTGQTYSGRASGFGDPYSVMMGRYSSHHMRVFGFSSPKLDRAVQGIHGYPAIRGREQQLIDYYGGVGNYKVGNRIRGVGYFNPLGRGYHMSSSFYFGEIAPYTGF